MAFVHLDVASAYSSYLSPSRPEDYVARLKEQRGTALCIADYGLHGAVRFTRAALDAGLTPILGLRVRVCAHRALRPWAEQPGELVLLARNETGWLNLVALNNLGHAAGWTAAGPRIDGDDLRRHADGLIALSGSPDEGLLARRAACVSDIGPLVDLARRLQDWFAGEFWLELVYHGYALEKLVNHQLIDISQRTGIGVVAANAVRFARRDEALAQVVLQAIGEQKRAKGLGRGGPLPNVTIDTPAAQAYLKPAAAMERLFGSLPDALVASPRIAAGCDFQLPLAGAAPRYGPRLFFGAGKDEEALAERLSQRARDGLARRYQDRIPEGALARLEDELRLITQRPELVDALLLAVEVRDFASEQHIPLQARGSATMSLVCWVLGLVSLNPFERGLDHRGFVYEDRPSLPDIDLETPAQDQPALLAFALQCGGAPASDPAELPDVRAVRLGTHISLGARNAVRSVGAALGLDGPQVNAIARLVPLLSSPGAIEDVLLRTPELGLGDASPNSEPYATVMQLSAKLESLPTRFSAHPSGLNASPAWAPGVLAWLPVQWVAPLRFHDRAHIAPRHVAAASLEATAEPGAVLAHAAPASLLDPEETPVLVCQWGTDDVDLLGLSKVDLSATTALPDAASDQQDAATRAAAWRLLEEADTLCLPQVETHGFRALLRRMRDARGQRRPPDDPVEDIAQLLALWRPGAYGGQEQEQAYFAVRYGGQPSGAIHPELTPLLACTSGQLLYANQLPELLEALGFDYAWADSVRRAVARGQVSSEDQQRLRTGLHARGWTDQQLQGFTALLLARSGYLLLHGHALALAERVFAAAQHKVNPRTAPAFFAEAWNCGGSHYGLGAAVEDGRRFGVLPLSPCVNRSSDAYQVEAHSTALARAEGRAGGLTGAVRAPLTAVRGLQPGAARHILSVRATSGEFKGLLDFVQRVDARLVPPDDVLTLIKVGAFEFTGQARARLALVHQLYGSLADMARAGDHDPSGLRQLDDAALPDGLLGGDMPEWPPGVLAAYELAHLGYYASAPLETLHHARRLAEEHGTVAIAQLVDYPDKAEAAIAGLITVLRRRRTRKSEEMAWLTVTDGTGSIETAVFPAAYARMGRLAGVHQSAFVVLRGRVSQEEASGPKFFADALLHGSGPGAQAAALAVSVAEVRKPTA